MENLSYVSEKHKRALSSGNYRAINCTENTAWKSSVCVRLTSLWGRTPSFPEDKQILQQLLVGFSAIARNMEPMPALPHRALQTSVCQNNWQAAAWLLISRWSDAEMLKSRENAGEQGTVVCLISSPSMQFLWGQQANQCCSFTPQRKPVAKAA